LKERGQNYDPDPSYELTFDNCLKMMAIYLRFRCNIPVMIMRETGCGKTRLIKYLCDLHHQDIKNLKILMHVKVHGGTTADIIKKKLDEAILLAQSNGNKIDFRYGLKIIAACNPYKKHSNEMIMKLEQDELGFYKSANDTKEKLGHIPMRQLVYRVQPLPASFLPLVWDFGQLNNDVEQVYIKQMLKKAIENHRLPFEASKEETDIW
jgi:hypothetical protein